jgi:hypothetical protein
MATLKKGKGRPPGKKTAEVATSTAKAKATQVEANTAPTTRPRGRLAAKKVVSDKGQKGALDALRARRDAALKPKTGTDSPAAELPVAPTGASSTPVLASKTRTSSSSKSRTVAAQRARTPSPRPDTDEDLYGLSPGGEEARLRVETRRQSTQQYPPPSALRAQGTPAVETSILALANFKRRPRQPSIIRMVQQTSELGNQSDFDETLADLDNTLRDFDEFNPDDESTPLHLTKRQSGSFSASTSHHKPATKSRNSSARKRKHDDEEDDIQVPRSSPPLASSPPRIARRTVSDPDSSATSSLPEHAIPSTELDPEPQADIGRYSETMAPPLSSSDISSPPRSRHVTNPRPDKRRKTTARPGREANVEATNSRKTKLKKGPKISTAALQSLLPSARNKKRSAAKTDTYDLPSSDSIDANDMGIEINFDSDELAQPARKRRATTATVRTPIGKADGNRGRKKKGAPNSPVPGRKALAPTANEKQRRTYGRTQAEKENDETLIISDEDSNSEDDQIYGDGARKSRQRDSGVGLAASTELAAARKKFEEVDQWEMEFESVDLGGGQSSASWR